MVQVKNFMVPAEKVVTATPSHTVREVLDIMITNKVGSVVIVNTQKKEAEASLQKESAGGEGTILKAMGIITNSDVLKAYRESTPIDAPCQKIMGRRRLVSCNPGDNRDTVARILEERHTHHIIVVDERHQHFVGLVSSWDVAAQCAKDGVPPPYDPEKPTTILNHEHGEAPTFMDDLDLAAFQ